MILGLRGMIKEREISKVYLWAKHLQYVAQDWCYWIKRTRVGLREIWKEFSLLMNSKSRMIMNHSYFFMKTVRAEEREGLCHYLIGVILGAVPQCSHQLDKDGRLPLHLASDPTTLQVLEKNTRYELVYDIWKAYPEAASVTDPLTGLPPFAMAARQEGKRMSLYRGWSRRWQGGR